MTPLPDVTARRRSAAGAVVAQFSQAAASFLLTVAAARYLGSAEFGVLALLVGALVLGTAVMTGFVGDSLTVLDRYDARIRTALELWCVCIATGLMVVGAVLVVGSRLLSLGSA